MYIQLLLKGDRKLKNIIVLTHGALSKGITQSSYFIVGEVENMTALSITLNETIEETVEMIESVWKDFQNLNPTVILTDLPGGSTTQAAIRWISKHPECYLISGVNLGLLLEIILLSLTQNRESNLEKLEHAVEQAQKSIKMIHYFCEGENDFLNDEL